MTLHVVQYSGGIGSWAATERVIAEHGSANLLLLIADTRIEDPDLWRFVHDSTARIGVAPTIVADGRTPFEVFHDQRFLGNSRLAPCSAILKQRPARSWLKQHADPADTVLYVGIDWSEAHRTPAIVKGWAPWTVRFPMCEPPCLSKQDMLGAARAVGLTPPRLYGLGFSHNNFFWTTRRQQLSCVNRTVGKTAGAPSCADRGVPRQPACQQQRLLDDQPRRPLPNSPRTRPQAGGRRCTAAGPSCSVVLDDRRRCGVR